ncbi:hypothetical protein JEZ13_04210 [bacterium]|nr:hypothetical protein [bacterium]MBI9072937.1 hypothetical protein [Melioribacteraceae bacterium]
MDIKAIKIKIINAVIENVNSSVDYLESEEFKILCTSKKDELIKNPHGSENILKEIYVEINKSMDAPAIALSKEIYNNLDLFKELSLNDFVDLYFNLTLEISQMQTSYMKSLVDIVTDLTKSSIISKTSNLLVN